MLLCRYSDGWKASSAAIVSCAPFRYTGPYTYLSLFSSYSHLLPKILPLAQLHGATYTGQLTYNPQDFRMWMETRVPRWNPRYHSECVHSPHGQNTRSIRNSCCWRKQLYQLHQWVACSKVQSFKLTLKFLFVQLIELSLFHDFMIFRLCHIFMNKSIHSFPFKKSRETLNIS